MPKKRLSPEDFLLSPCSPAHMETLYKWKAEEKSPQSFSCRPLQLIHGFEDWKTDFETLLASGKMIVKVLERKDKPGIPLGRFDSFDYNPRNRSIEIGYYFPLKHRSKGYGSIGLLLLLASLFTDRKLKLNKVYATTSSNNLASISLLEKNGFTKDGENREHYWIDEKKYGQLVFSMLKREWKALSSK